MDIGCRGKTGFPNVIVHNINPQTSQGEPFHSFNTPKTKYIFTLDKAMEDN